MLFKSQVYTSASGSVNGATYSRNRFGAYVRARANPVNPNTTRQSEARARFAVAIQEWSALTQPQRDVWIDYANAVPGLNRVGDTVTLTGQNMFVRCNTMRALHGEAYVTAGPTTFNRGNPASSVTDYELDAGVFATSVGIEGGASAAGDLSIFFGRPQNASRKFYKSPWQYAAEYPVALNATSQAASITLASCFSDYTPTIGQNFPVKFVMTYDDGRVPESFVVMKTVISGA